MLARVPADTTVFCIIDGLSLYVNNSERSRDAQRLVRRLLRLTLDEKKKRACKLKLFLTTANLLRTPEVEDLLDDDSQVLHLQSRLPRTIRYNSTNWDRLLGELLKSLDDEGFDEKETSKKKSSKKSS